MHEYEYRRPPHVQSQVQEQTQGVISRMRDSLFGKPGAPSRPDPDDNGEYERQMEKLKKAAYEDELNKIKMEEEGIPNHDIINV